MANDLNAIIQKMIDAGESEENIATVIQHHKFKDTVYKQSEVPGDFWGGVKEAASSGAIGDAMNKGVEGFVKGAVTNLPSSIMSGVRTIGNMVVDPLQTTKDVAKGLFEAPGQMWETTKQAGTNPEAFGEMMGEITGQPAVTAGLVKGVPPIAGAAARGAVRNAYKAGPALETTGRLIQDYRPVTGFVPRRLRDWTVPSHLVLAEDLAGRGMEWLGKRLSATEPIPKPPKVTSYGRKPTVTSERVPTPPSPAPTSAGPSRLGPARLGNVRPPSQMGTSPQGIDVGPSPGLLEATMEPRQLGVGRPQAQIPANIPGRPVELGPAPTRLPASTMSTERFPKGKIYDRWRELTKKARDGDITMDELTEARDLDKKLRQADIDPIDVNTGEYVGPVRR